MSLKRAVFAPLEGAELEGAVEAILHAGLAPEAFILEERRTEQVFGGGGSVVHKLVSVKRLANGTQRQYSTGRGGGWPFEFERDLRCGFYAYSWPSHPGTPSATGAAP